MLSYVQLALSIIFAVAGDTCMKLSRGFALKRYIPLVAAGYALSIYLQSLVTEVLPLGFVYATWNALQISLVAVVGALMFGERWNSKKVAGIAAIICGVAILSVGKGM